MRTTTASIFRFIAVLVLIASTLASSALADYVEASSYWAANRGPSISVNQGASPDLLVFVSSDAEFRLWIDVIRGRSVVRNIVSNVPVMAGVGNPYLHTFPIPTADLGGDYIVRVQVRNGAAFDDSYVNLHIATVPVMNSVPDQLPMNEGESRTIQVSGFDLDGDSISLEASQRYCMVAGRICFARDLPMEATFTDRGDGTGFLQFQPGFDFVTHPDRAEDITFQFRAYDGNRRTGWQAATITVNDVNLIPQIISVPVTNAQEGTFYEYIISAVDADREDRLSYSLVESPAGMAISRSRVEWTPTYDQAGEHDVTVQVSDGIDAVRQSYTITVANYNRAPVLGPLQDQVVNEGEQLVFTVTASDPDGEALVLRAGNLPPGAVFVDSGLGTAQFSWVPNNQQSGEYDIFISVTDGNAVDRGTVHITVVDVTLVCSEGDNIAARGCVCQVPLANIGGVCRVPPPVSGCTDPTALNYNPLATVDDGSCAYPVPVPGCTNPAALNYNPLATVDDGSCTFPPGSVLGCTDPAALNFDPAATVDDGSCTYPEPSVPGCTDPAALNYNPLATVDDGSCTYPVPPVPGCTDPAALNYNPNATADDGSCTYPVPNITGCTDPAALNYNPTASVDDGSCTYPVPSVLGCTDSTASNYNPTATSNDHSCIYFPVSGCTNPNALNYDRRVRTDDGSCEYMRRGIVILSVHPSQEAVSAGESVQFNVDVKNNAETAANDLQIRAMLYDLSEVGYGRQFNLRAGRSSSQAVVLQIPYGVWPGRYVVQFTVDNGQVRDTTYRELTIN